MKDISKQPNQKEESLIVKMLVKYLTYWPLFLAFLIIVLGLAYGYLRYTAPKYEAVASLIIKDEKKGIEDSKITESLNMINAKKIIENETEVLQSRPVLERVVKKLHLYAPIYQEGDFNLRSAYLASPVTIESMQPDSLISTNGTILLKYDSDNGAIFLDNKFIGTANDWIKTPYGTLKFVPNSKYMGNLLQKPYYFQLYGMQASVKMVQDNLKVTATNKLSSVVNLRYKDDTPQLAEDVLNEIIFSYNNAITDEKKALAKVTLSFIEDRLNMMGNELDLIEQKIQHYKANSGAVDISTQGHLFLENVSLNDQKMSEVNVQLTVINQLEKQLSESDNSIGVLPTALGISDPTLTQLIASLNTAELERERLKKTVAENNPLLVSVYDQITKVKNDIIIHIQRQRISLEASKSNLTNANNDYNTMLYKIPVKERELLEISRDQNIKNGIYSFLLQKREESELSYASTISESRVVNYAQASDIPVSPNNLLILGLSFIAIFGMPITYINAREALNPNILYRQEIESLTSIPIIAEVAFNKSGKSLAVEPGKRTFISEEFRKIRNSLFFKGIDENHKKILVTSAISGEGKSFIAANLAISFSLTGKKVALLTMDLHNSSLCKIFGKVSQVGVSDYLAGNNKADDIINEVPLYENLFFIPSGTLKEMPSELLENGRVQKLINYLESRFDMIVIDSEPFELVADAHLLSSISDVTIYVVRHRYSPKILLKRFDQNNEVAPLNNPVIIFNAVKTRGYFKDFYGHGYGYGYMYGEKELIKRKKKNKLFQHA